ncbi:MAG: putative porin [Candidatus Omnitrophota bacterium]
MRKFVAAAVLLGFIVAATGMRTSYAGEIDLLLQKLVEKGVLTGAEAQQVKIETQEQVKKEIATSTSATLPAWVQNIKLKGDFRLRYQVNHAKAANDITNNRQRARIRLRLGMESKVNEKLLVAFGLGTGLNEYTATSADTVRSTNQSLGNSFAKKPFNLDYAYAKYMPFPGFALFGGKLLLSDSVWEPGDMIWDTDITPEGVAFDVNKKVNPSLNMFLKSGVYFLEEISGSNDDPYFVHMQPGFTGKLSDTISLKSGVALDYFVVKNHALDGSTNTNTGSKGGFAYPTANFFTVSPAVEVKIKEPFSALGVSFLNVPQLKLFGEFVTNIADVVPDDNKTGQMFGASLGAEKIAGWGDWQATYNFVRLERNAILDILPDSDRYGGQTNIKAHEFKFAYGLGKNTWLELDVYRAQKLAKPFAPETLIQVDWNLKF